MPSPEALNIQQDIKNTATNTSSIDKEYIGKAVLAQQELNKLVEELNTIKEKGEKSDSLVSAELLKQQKLIETIKSEHTKILDFQKRAKAIADSTGQNYKDVLKAEQKILETKIKSNAIAGKDLEIAKKQLAILKESSKIETERFRAAGRAAASTSGMYTGRAASGLVGGPQATAGMIAGMIGSLTTAVGSLAGPIGGAIGGAIGPILSAAVTLAFWGIEKSYESKNKGLLLDAARGGRPGEFNILGSRYLTSGEYGGLAEQYAKSGMHANQLTGASGIGGFTGLEGLGGLSKVMGSANVSKMAEILTPFMDSSVNNTLKETSAQWDAVVVAMEKTGIAADKVMGWMSNLREQAQYMNVDFKLVQAQMLDMTKNKKDSLMASGINWARDGGNIMQRIMGLAKTMPMTSVMAMASLREKGVDPFVQYQQRKRGKGFLDAMSFSGEGGNWRMNVDAEKAKKGEKSGALDEVMDIKNFMYQSLKGIKPDSKEGKAKIATIIPMLMQKHNITEDEAMTIAQMEIKKNGELTNDQLDLIKNIGKNGIDKTNATLANINKGMLRGELFANYQEKWMARLNALLPKNFASHMLNGLEKIMGFVELLAADAIDKEKEKIGTGSSTMDVLYSLPVFKQFAEVTRGIVNTGYNLATGKQGDFMYSDKMKKQIKEFNNNSGVELGENYKKPVLINPRAEGDANINKILPSNKIENHITIEIDGQKFKPIVKKSMAQIVKE